jgi:NADH dehydrogenase
MTVVVVGGGPTGVELAGAFVELANHVLKRDFQNIDPSQARIVLVEAGPKILSQFPDPLPAKAVETLKEMGVEVRLNCPVQDIGEGFVRLPDETIHAANIIWGAGVMGHPLTRTLGVELDRGGRIKVMPDLSLPGHPEVFAVGDLVSLVDVNGQVVPGVSPAAIQMGGFVAKIINAEASGSSDSAKRPGFAYRDKGIMATIGRSKGVAFIASMKFTGFLAWLLWLGVHLIFLIGFRNKLAVLLQWFYSYVNYKRGARIIVDLPRSQPPG